MCKTAKKDEEKWDEEEMKKTIENTVNYHISHYDQSFDVISERSSSFSHCNSLKKSTLFIQFSLICMVA